MRVRGLLAASAALMVLVVVATACSDSEGDAGGGAASSTDDGAFECEWPMFGQGAERRFSYPCDTELSPETVGGLTEEWFFNTEDVVTAAPAVVDGTVYAGDWAGNVYALDLDSGEEIWRIETRVHPTVYSGQVTASPAVADVDGQRTVFVAGGKTMYALDAASGEIRWEHELGEPGDDSDFTEIQSSPVVTDGTVIFGFDAHDQPGFRAGVLALDATTGDEVWYWDPDEGAEPSGCAGVWSSPSVDHERGTVFVGTANCSTSPEGWLEYSEAIVALDLETGDPRWSFQPHEPNRNDLDFAGAPNLFEVDGQAVVGLGNKDGSYYVVDRESGELVWEVQATEPEFEEGSNFSFGGFIGATAAEEGIIAGGTAGQGPSACPCLHAINAETGELLWQAEEPQPIYGPSAVAGDVLFTGGTDFTFRAVDLRTGETLWSHEMTGVVAGGPAIVGSDVVAVAGIREPGVGEKAESAGITRFTLPDDGEVASATTTSTTLGSYEGPVVLAPSDQACVDAECEFALDFPPPPDGLAPTAVMRIDTDPFRIRIEAEGMGDPEQWVAENAPDADEGAEVFVTALVESTENPVGTFVCTFDESGVCEGDTIPQPTPTFERFAILALADDESFPSVAAGAARLVYTEAFDPLLEVLEPPLDQ